MELAIAFNYLTRFNLPLKDEPKPRLIRKAMGLVSDCRCIGRYSRCEH